MVFVRIKQLVNPFKQCLAHGEPTVNVSCYLVVKTSNDVQQRAFNTYSYLTFHC